MTKAEIEQKIAEVRAQGEALQKHNSQIMQQLEVNKVELAKICGKIELLSDMLSELEKTPTEGENGEAEKDADENDNG
ncbi:MAG: hypothetical protein ACLUE4_06245 [Acutalibacteraceae bacterium]